MWSVVGNDRRTANRRPPAQQIVPTSASHPEERSTLSHFIRLLQSNLPSGDPACLTHRHRIMYDRGHASMHYKFAETRRSVDLEGPRCTRFWLPVNSIAIRRNDGSNSLSILGALIKDYLITLRHNRLPIIGCRILEGGRLISLTVQWPFHDISMTDQQRRWKGRAKDEELCMVDGSRT